MTARRLLRLRDAFDRIHERPWVYAASFAVPVAVALGVSYVVDSLAPLAFALYVLYTDAVWRHRMHEIDREGCEKLAAIDEKFARRGRVLAHARADRARWAALMADVDRRGDDALDDYPLPPGEN